MCHRMTLVICSVFAWNRVCTKVHATVLNDQLFSRVRVIAVRAFWPSGLHSDCEGNSEM
jgi:hypothetical protein